jgi:lipid-A-disaccharide synthase
MSKVLIVAGEASGDSLGAGLVKELLRLNRDYKFFGLGGDKMSTAGVKLIYHIKDLAFLGFWEVVKNLRLIKKVERELFAEVDEQKPEMAILIDYPGFNLKLAPQLRSRGIKIFYYVSPQIWAWGATRIDKIKRDIDLMAVFFDFEKDIYEKAEVPVIWVGHPLLDEIAVCQNDNEFRKQNKLDSEALIIGLFPGSRKLEVSRILPEMLKAFMLIKAKKPKAVGMIGKAGALDDELYRDMINEYAPGTILYNGPTYDLMAHAGINLVCSGTATLECALIGTPFLIAYKTSFLTYLIARWLIKIPHIGLANVVAGKNVARELIQHECSGPKIAEEALAILSDQSQYYRIREELLQIRAKLGQPGAAQRSAAAANDLYMSRTIKG